MKRIVFAALALVCAMAPARAQQATTVATCGSITWDTAGVPRPITQDVNGNLCTGSASGPLPSGASTAANQTSVQANPGSDATKAIAVQGVTGGKAVPVSAASLPLPSGASTAAKQPALGTAGSASADVLSVQGVASMTALKVDGSAVTQPVSTNPTSVTTTDKSGTIASGGVAQSPIALNASRKAWCIQNDPAATETLYVRVNGTAASGVGAALSPGDQACNSEAVIDTAAVSVFAATTGHVFEGFEKQ